TSPPSLQRLPALPEPPAVRAIAFSGKMEAMTPPPADSHRSAPNTGKPRFHGEYKVHGGKLVVVDLDVDGGRFRNVSVSGDFFLEPDDALDDINRALEGL